MGNVGSLTQGIFYMFKLKNNTSGNFLTSFFIFFCSNYGTRTPFMHGDSTNEKKNIQSSPFVDLFYCVL